MKTLIIDCDGVLYPEYQFPLSKEIKAIELQAYANNISKEQYQKISNETLKRGEKGLFNFILNLCNKKMNAYNIFCQYFMFNIYRTIIFKFDTIIFKNDNYTHIIYIIQLLYI